jgi:hypothetical protein
VQQNTQNGRARGPASIALLARKNGVLELLAMRALTTVFAGI